MPAKKGSFKSELQSVFDVVKSSDVLNKEDFVKNKERLKPLLRNVVDTTQEYINAITDDDDNGDLNEDAKNGLENIESKLKHFLSLNAEIERKISDVDKENVSKVVK